VLTVLRILSIDGYYHSDDDLFLEASLSTLKQLAVVKSQHIPQLGALIPYIDIVPNQEYLIQRIRGKNNQ
jgi:hypothetical protein